MAYISTQISGPNSLHLYSVRFAYTATGTRRDVYRPLLKWCKKRWGEDAVHSSLEFCILFMRESDAQEVYAIFEDGPFNFLSVWFK